MITTEDIRRIGKDSEELQDEFSDYSCTGGDESEGFGESEERDEVGEAKKFASKDTCRLRFWRVVVTLVLLVTALVVTIVTYFFLKNAEESNFVEAFRQFSRTVADAEIERRGDIHDAMESLSDTLTSSAEAANATWPFFTLHNFESYAQHNRLQSKTELTTVSNIVEFEQWDEWVAYSNRTHEKWVKEGHMLSAGNLDRLSEVSYQPAITQLTAEGIVPEIPRPSYAVYWSFSPPPANYALVNGNIRSVPDYDQLFTATQALRNETVVSRVRPYATAVGVAFTEEQRNGMHSELPPGETEHPHSFLMHPVFEKVRDPSSKIVAVLLIGSAWDATLKNLLPDGVNGIDAVIRNNCDQSFTYRINGADALYLGWGDLHEEKYNDMRVDVSLSSHTHGDFMATPGHCVYELNLYPTSDFEAAYDSRTHDYFAIIIACTFAMVAVVFCVYDVLVQKQNTKLMLNVARSNAIVTQLFPNNIRDKLIGSESTSKDPLRVTSKSGLTDYFKDGKTGDSASKPLADLFLDSTVMFADIAGFTAWSSVREPQHVFELLETVYAAFDTLAHRRHIFKVETVGDCYVAVAGVPQPRPDHAVIMVRFARDIMRRMQQVVKGLEVSLGPDTGDLNIRIGLHSGPVTGGVLRGERARFQLFGDTMNTTARIESTCEVGRIQMSKETASHLVKSGKEQWITKREGGVMAKGKGQMETYYLKVTDIVARPALTADSSCSSDASLDMDLEDPVDRPRLSERTHRLIEWNCEVLLHLLKRIIARRSAENPDIQTLDQSSRASNRPSSVSEDSDGPVSGTNFVDEVVEIIHLPEFDHALAETQKSPDDIVLANGISSQLQQYVKCVAGMYRKNKFHNFEHASHVLMSVTKLMSRIVAPTDIDFDRGTLHDHTYGITSDPLTQFTCALAAIIHDADHTGVPNAQLLNEDKTFSSLYNNRSMAEQNSLDLAWQLLMEDRFEKLRSAIFSTPDEQVRFRQLLVNSVMATDIADKELKVARNARWDKAFKSEDTVVDSKRDAVNRKATIVIEHLIQASDVSHTMQHWHVYRKWNECLFQECYRAYLDGRAPNDPSIGWYKGEIGFFDFYIIPLAKKLKDCGVFGKSSDEYLTYATQNRQEWEARGEALTAELLERTKRKMSAPSDDE